MEELIHILAFNVHFREKKDCNELRNRINREFKKNKIPVRITLVKYYQLNQDPPISISAYKCVFAHINNSDFEKFISEVRSKYANSIQIVGMSNVNPNLAEINPDSVQGVLYQDFAEGVNASDYDNLNWVQACKEWLNMINTWKTGGQKGDIPKFPIQILMPKSKKNGWDLLMPFSALDILLQGYLAIRKTKEIFGKNYRRFKEEHNILKEQSQRRTAKDKTHYSGLQTQRLFRPVKCEGREFEGEPSGPQHLGWFWFDECLPDVKEKSYNDLVREYEPLKDRDNLRKVWGLLRGECLGNPDCRSINEICQGWTQKKFTDLFEDAHREYLSLFEEEDEKKQMKKLESVRSLLNHNKVKNEFLNVVGSVRKDLSLEERSKNIAAIWSSLKETYKTQESEVQAKIDTARRGLGNWPNLYEELKNFFEEVPAKFGFKLTEKGMRVKRNFFKGTKSYTAVIDRFVKEFDDIAYQSDEEKGWRLQEFWAAADEIHNALSNMALKKDEDKPFGRHFEQK